MKSLLSLARASAFVLAGTLSLASMAEFRVSPDVGVATLPTKKSKADDVGEKVVPKKAPPSPEAAQSAPVVAASEPVALPPSPPPEPEFVLRKGDEIGAAMSRWCDQTPAECSEVSWEAGRLISKTEYSAKGRFLDAVQGLLQALDASGVRLNPSFFKDNKQLRITEHKS